MTSTIDKQELLAAEGCPWAKRTPQELYLGINQHLAQFGFAFGHGEFDREGLEEVYLAPFSTRCSGGSRLATAITETGLINKSFQVRVHYGLEAVIERAIQTSPATSWDGWAWDVARMAQGGCSWEFAAGEVLYGMSLKGENTWLVSGMMDPGMWCEGEGWLTFALAEDVLPNPVPGRDGSFEGLTYDSICELAFGKSAD